MYNIDLDPVRQYLLERSLFPAAKLKGDFLDDCQYALDYENSLYFYKGTRAERE